MLFFYIYKTSNTAGIKKCELGQLLSNLNEPQ